MRIIDALEKVVITNQVQRELLGRDIPSSCVISITLDVTGGTAKAPVIEIKDKRKPKKEA